MNEYYFVIYNTDGETFVEMLRKDQLITRLNEKYYGERGFIEKITEHDTNYWRDNILVIKGNLIVPKAKKVIIEHEVE